MNFSEWSFFKILSTWLIIPFIVAFDFLTKRWIEVHYYLWEVDPIFADIIRFTHVRNSGAAFGIMQGFPNFFKYITIIALLGIGMHKLLTSNKSFVYHIALGLIMSGACGNLLDRFRHEFVVDFIDVGFGALRWPAFNIADISISIGVAILLLISFHAESKGKSALEPAEEKL
ncbi:MAG: signal peptidase II [Candidatus Hydrogenedentes bacterium CG07_land_8_20_14_0_80_42_17]|nr:MAG: signal peptidase II [Candidatus Hydrogenedentes bacterium CG07_land_8_20_14_0_80_42_17]